MTNSEFPIVIDDRISIQESEVTLSAIRAQGAGGQNVNKVSSAVHLRFDVNASTLPDHIKQKLCKLNDQRISSDGIVVIKAQQFRTREKNRVDALERLEEIIRGALHEPKPRKATRPSKTAKKKRVDAKVKKGKTKALRKNIPMD